MPDTVYDLQTAETVMNPPKPGRYEIAYSYPTQFHAVQCVRILYALGIAACWEQCGQWFDVYEANPMYA